MNPDSRARNIEHRSAVVANLPNLAICKLNLLLWTPTVEATLNMANDCLEFAFGHLAVHAKVVELLSLLG